GRRRSPRKSRRSSAARRRSDQSHNESNRVSGVPQMSNQGKIVQIIGAVVDVEFPLDSVPNVYDALKVDGTEITPEVQHELAAGVVRTIALGSTAALERDLVATNTGSAISVPV